MSDEERLSGDKTTVYKIVPAGAETGGIRSEEIHQFSHFFWPSDFPTCIKIVLCIPIVLDTAVVHFCEILEQIVDQRGPDSAGADGIYPDVLGPEVNGKAAGYLSQGTLGQTICKAVGLSNEPLIRTVYNNTATPGFHDVRYSLTQGVYGAVDIGLDYQIKLFVSYVEQCVASVDSGVCEYAVQLAEASYCGFDCVMDIGTYSGVAFDK